MRIGILGGMTPESTVTYYQHIVHAWQQRHGDHRYPAPDREAAEPRHLPRRAALHPGVRRAVRVVEAADP